MPVFEKPIPKYWKGVIQQRSHNVIKVRYPRSLTLVDYDINLADQQNYDFGTRQFGIIQDDRKLFMTVAAHNLTSESSSATIAGATATRHLHEINFTGDDQYVAFYELALGIGSSGNVSISFPSVVSSCSFALYSLISGNQGFVRGGFETRNNPNETIEVPSTAGVLGIYASSLTVQPANITYTPSGAVVDYDPPDSPHFDQKVHFRYPLDSLSGGSTYFETDNVQNTFNTDVVLWAVVD